MYFIGLQVELNFLAARPISSLRTADAFPVVASEGEKRRPEMRLLFAGYQSEAIPRTG